MKARQLIPEVPENGNGLFGRLGVHVEAEDQQGIETRIGLRGSAPGETIHAVTAVEGAVPGVGIVEIDA